MSRLRRKRVGDAVMERIVAAIREIAADESAPRTKREIERRTGLSHDAVARAFRQDSEEENRWQISKEMVKLTDGGANRRSPQQNEKVEVAQQLADSKQRLSEAQAQNERYAVALYAFQIQRTAATVPDSSKAVPIGKNRRRDRRVD